MLGRQDPQMDLADAVLWTGKIEPKEDVDTHFARTRSAGAMIVEDLHETIYGERQYGVEDLDGHHWLFSEHASDVSPDEWGATVIEPAFEERDRG